MITEQQIENVITFARNEAWEASARANKAIGNHDPLRGIVWVSVDAKRNSSLGKLLSKFGLCKHADKPGLIWHNPSGYAGNNYKIQLAGAKRAAEILGNALGVTVTAGFAETL